MADLELAVLGQAPATADSFYQLGIKYSVGADVAADLVSAHKWFNLAAMKGNKDAIQLRQEIAAGHVAGRDRRRAARRARVAHRALERRDRSAPNARPLTGLLASRPALRHTRAFRRRGRVAEGGGLLNRYTLVKAYRGFESLRLRHPLARYSCASQARPTRR